MYPALNLSSFCKLYFELLDSKNCSNIKASSQTKLQQLNKDGLREALSLISYNGHSLIRTLTAGNCSKRDTEENNITLFIVNKISDVLHNAPNMILGNPLYTDFEKEAIALITDYTLVLNALRVILHNHMKGSEIRLIATPHLDFDVFYNLKRKDAEGWLQR